MFQEKKQRRGGKKEKVYPRKHGRGGRLGLPAAKGWEKEGGEHLLAAVLKKSCGRWREE